MGVIIREIRKSATPQFRIADIRHNMLHRSNSDDGVESAANET